VWQDLDHGRLRVISSVGIISYGWDHPIVSCIVGARPTASVGLWLQQIGRGSRPHPESGKRDLLILDHAGNSGRLNVLYEDDRTWSLEGAGLRDGAPQAEPITTCRHCYATFRRGPKQCPYCDAPIEKKAREIVQLDGELAEYKRKRIALEQWARSQSEDERRQKYEEFRRIARERGYSPKWPAVRFKVIFGSWPPRVWQHSA
jgi:superfamily II DNA or RNA helicase